MVLSLIKLFSIIIYLGEKYEKGTTNFEYRINSIY